MARKRMAVEPAAAFCFALILPVVFSAGTLTAFAQYPTQPQISKDGTAVLLEDYATPPLSSPTRGNAAPGPVDMKGQLGRVTSLRSEPANAPLAASRFFVVDQNSTLYVLDKAGKKFTPYLNFAAVFAKFTSEFAGAPGIVSLAFDPGYAKNGKFYTVHVEKPENTGPEAPTNARFPALDLRGYATTPVINPPAGPAHLESVLIEWTDTNVRNATFEGTAREILRTGYDRLIPMADMLFNPLARPGNSDYGNLYLAVGDGTQGETVGPGHTLPQRLDTLVGKILRITPDLNLRPNDQLSTNGRYRIPSTGPDPNPFLSVAGARAEIYAYGFRNQHRMAWDAVSKTLLVNDLGVRAWEEIDIVTKGGNYGYPEREANEQFFVDSGKPGSRLNPQVPFPERDLLQVAGLDEPVAPVYPAAVYSHADGDAIGSGVVYRGKLMPRLRGKYIFNDITTGRIFYVDLAELLATHGQRGHPATIHEIQILYKKSNGSASQTPVKTRMFDIIAETYKQRGGIPPQDRLLPGTAGATTGWSDPEHRHPKADPEGIAYGGGRADVRMTVGGDGEIYVLSKSDGMIRKLTAVVTPPPRAKP